TRLPSAGLPGPERAKALPVPVNHGFGTNEMKRLSPPSPMVGEPYPEETTEAPESRSLRTAAEQGKLLPKRQILERELAAGSERRAQGAQESEYEGHCPHGSHAARTSSSPGSSFGKRRLAVPANHGLRANEVERLAPTSPPVGEPHPEGSIEAPNCGRFEWPRNMASCCRSARFSSVRSTRVVSAARRTPNRASARYIALHGSHAACPSSSLVVAFWQRTGRRCGRSTRWRGTIWRRCSRWIWRPRSRRRGRLRQ